MISAIINVLEQVAPKVGVAYGLCTQETDEAGKKWIVQYVGGGQAKRVEGPSWSYWRVTGAIKQKRTSDLTGCMDATLFSVPLRYVLCGDRDVCGPEPLNSVAMTMRSKAKYVERTLGAFMAEMNSASVETDPNRGRQEIVDTPVPLHMAIGYIDLTIDVTGTEECLLACDPLEQNVPTY
jgi:hypothetical protein